MRLKIVTRFAALVLIVGVAFLSLDSGKVWADEDWGRH